MEQTRWLDETDQRTWRTFLVAVTLLFEQFDQDLQHSAAMPLAYYEVLVRLSEAPEQAMRMSELAKRCQSSRSRLSHAIARLEESRLVRRETCPTDRRGAIAVLTEEGFAALAAAAPFHVESVRAHLFDQLDREQLDNLGQISETILQHLIEAKALTLEEALGELGGCEEAPGACPTGAFEAIAENIS